MLVDPGLDGLLGVAAEPEPRERDDEHQERDRRQRVEKAAGAAHYLEPQPEHAGQRDDAVTQP